MEIKKGGQTLVGFPALIDGGDAVTIEVFDEPEVAAAFAWWTDLDPRRPVALGGGFPP